MQKELKIAFDVKIKVVEELLKRKNIKEFKKKGFFSEIFSSKIEKADIYFHSSKFDEKTLEMAKNSDFIIVNSFKNKQKLQKLIKIDSSKIEVLYPSVDVKEKNIEDLKVTFQEKYNFDFEKKIIIFTGKDFKSSGLKEFLKLIFSLDQDEYQAIIAGDSKQIEALKFQMPAITTNKNVVLIENYESIEELFYISDIFVLPTSSEVFVPNILKAMYCQCAVFVPISNDSSEVVDTYSKMDSSNDASMTFKVDALLLSDEDLEQIKIENKNKATNYTLQANLKKIDEILENF